MCMYLLTYTHICIHTYTHTHPYIHMLFKNQTWHSGYLEQRYHSLVCLYFLTRATKCDKLKQRYFTRIMCHTDIQVRTVTGQTSIRLRNKLLYSKSPYFYIVSLPSKNLTSHLFCRDYSHMKVSLLAKLYFLTNYIN